MNELKEGVRVKEVYWQEGAMLRVGSVKCESIEVVMQQGQMGLVPWFRAVVDGRTQLHNAAMCEGCLMDD